VYGLAMLAQVLDDSAAICTIRTDKWLDAGVNDELMSDKLGSHCELFHALITTERLLTMTALMTA